MKLKGSLSFSENEMVQFRILRTARREHSKLTTLDFGRTDFGFFRNLLGRAPWDKVLEGRGAHKEKVRQKHWEICMDEQRAPGQTQAEKGGIQRVETRTGSLRGIHRHCPSSQESG